MKDFAEMTITELAEARQALTEQMQAALDAAVINPELKPEADAIQCRLNSLSLEIYRREYAC